MNGSRSKSRRKGGILDGHTRVGKKLKSPLATIGNFRHTSYIDEILPELLHIAMAFRAYGYHDGMRLCEGLFEAARPFNGKSSLPFASNLIVDPNDQSSFIGALEDASILASWQKINSPLALLEDWPLAFMGTMDMPRERAVSHLEDCVGSILDRSETPACATMAVVVYWQGMSGKLHLASDMTKPDLNAIIADPESEEAQMASSFVRSFIMACWGASSTDGGMSGKWSRSFWPQAMRLSPCRVRHAEVDPDA